MPWQWSVGLPVILEKVLINPIMQSFPRLSVLWSRFPKECHEGNGNLGRKGPFLPLGGLVFNQAEALYLLDVALWALALEKGGHLFLRTLSLEHSSPKGSW